MLVCWTLWVFTAGLIPMNLAGRAERLPQSHRSPATFGGAMTASRIQLTISVLCWLGEFALISALIADAFR